MFWTIIIFAAFAYAAYHLAFKFGDKENVKANVIRAVIVGVAVVALRNYLIPMFPEVSWLFLIVILGFICGVTYQFYKQGDELNEFVAAAALIGLSGFIASAAASNYGSVFPLLLATVIPVLAIGFCAISALYYNRERAEDAKVKSKMNKLMALATVLTLVLLAGGAKLAFSLADYGKDSEKPVADETVTKTVSAEDDNRDSRFVQKWTENENNRLDSEFAAKLAKKAEAEDGTITPEIVQEAVLENCGHDARMLAIWANAFGLRDDPNDYESLLTEDKTYLSNEGISLYNKVEGYLAATAVTREEAPADGVNTGYNDGYVAAESAGIDGDRSGTKFVSPDKDIEPFWLMDRCSNLVYKRPPKVPKGPTDNPTPTPDNPKNMKDPSKIPKKNTEPNDDKGPGPNTNNPSDPNHSTKDTKDSSTSMTYDDYKKNVDNLKDTNKNQKTGSDSNTPSTPKPSPNTNVDNNGDKGNGGAPINTPTPKREAETVKDDPAAGHMDEPS